MSAPPVVRPLFVIDLRPQKATHCSSPLTFNSLINFCCRYLSEVNLAQELDPKLSSGQSQKTRCFDENFDTLLFCDQTHKEDHGREIERPWLAESLNSSRHPLGTI